MEKLYSVWPCITDTDRVQFLKKNNTIAIYVNIRFGILPPVSHNSLST